MWMNDSTQHLWQEVTLHNKDKSIVFSDFQKTFFRLITGLSQEPISAEATLSNYSSQRWKIKLPEWSLAVQISYLGGTFDNGKLQTVPQTQKDSPTGDNCT